MPTQDRRQQGSAVIEMLVFMWVLLFFTVVILVIGIVFWNQTVMSTTAQQAALASQTTVDRYCSNSFDADSQGCLNGIALARQRAQSVTASSGEALIDVDPGSLTLVEDRNLAGSGQRGTLGFTFADNQSLPATIGGDALTPGWGYTFIEIRARTTGPARALRALSPGTWDGRQYASALVFSYDDPQGGLR